MIQPTTLPLSILDKNEGQIPGVPKNPRKWSDEEVVELAESIQETPTLMDARPLMVFPIGGRYVVIDGNMRLDALRLMKRENALCFIIPESTPPNCVKNYITKTNALYAEWIKAEVEILGSGKWAQRAFFENTKQSFAKNGANEIDVDNFSEKIALSFKFNRRDYDRVICMLHSIDGNMAEAIKKVCGV